MVRLVCTSPTLMGVVGLERRAAAAAADDSEVFELRRPNTAAAAVAALGSAVAEVKGYGRVTVSMVSQGAYRGE